MNFARPILFIFLNLSFLNIYAQEKDQSPSIKSDEKKMESAGKTVTQATPPAPPTEPAEQKKAGRKPINMNEAMVLTYGSAKWNIDSTKIDSASVIFRDAKSNKSVIIILDETAPDSSIFRGKFLVKWTDVDEVTPEVYIPPQELVKTNNWMKKFQELSKAGNLPRKPYISHKEENGDRAFEVFDTKEQAHAAAKAFEEKKKLAKESETKSTQPNPQLEKAISKTAAAAIMEADALAKMQAEALRLAEEAASREAERLRLAQIEKQKEEEAKRKQAALNAAEKARRKQQAIDLADEALEHYQKGDFPEAEQKFRKSIELDPENTSYYYKYGVSLYKVNKYNESIVFLRQVQGDDFDPIERDYYLGLNHYKLKESDQAFEMFGKVKAANSKQLSPSAAFYQGVIKFDVKKYEEAKTPFQEVLDNSDSDPKLDEQAEKYIEQISRILYFAAQKAKTFLFSGTFGLQYDSNILLTSDTVLDQGSPSGAGGIRYLAVANAEHRPIYEKDKEFSERLTLVYIYSADSRFVAADPMIVTLSFPFVYKGMLMETISKFDITPAYEVLYMDSDSNGERELLLNSVVLNLNNTMVLSEARFSSISASLRADESQITPSGTTETEKQANNPSAFKLTLGTNQIKFLDKEKKSLMSGDLGYTINNAQGSNYYYTRFDLKGTYSAPYKWESTWFAQLGYYLADYSKKSTARVDNNYTFTTGLSKTLKEKWIAGLTASYTIQNSDSANTYKKWMLMTSITSNFDF